MSELEAPSLVNEIIPTKSKVDYTQIQEYNLAIKFNKLDILYLNLHVYG